MQDAWRDNPSGGGPQFALPPISVVAKRLILIQVGIFFFSWMLSFGGGDATLFRWFGISPQMWTGFPPPIWQVFTYGFLHSTSVLMHLLGNMLMLYFLGTMLEGIVGGRRFLMTFLSCVLAGGVLTVLVGVLLGEVAPTIGASAGALGVAVAAATLRPKQQIIFFIFPMTLRTLALILVALDLFAGINLVFKAQATGVAHFAHLGGAAWGFLLINRGWIWKDPLAEVERRVEERQAASVQRDRERVDELLEKIHQSGINSLSTSEKSFLKRASKRSG